MKAGVALLAVLACARVVVADPEADADRAFREASALAIRDEPAAIAAFEVIGTARPLTRWTDDAWSEVGRLAERAGDFPRARRAFGEVLATSRDDKTRSRARAALDRLNAVTRGGAWDAVARDHRRWLDDVYDGGDPREALHALEALSRANPGYPRRVDLALAVARGWELEGHGERALRWYRTAMEIAGPERQRAGLARARAQIRAGALDGARVTLDALSARADADRMPIADVRASLDAREIRVRVRWVMWIVLALVGLGAAAGYRRATGSWRAAARRFATPPVEALFLLPIALVLVVVARTGNPLVGGAVTAIVGGAVLITWLNGSLLEAWRSRTWRHVLGHVLVALVATGALVYLATEQHIDFIAETWEHGPER